MLIFKRQISEKYRTLETVYDCYMDECNNGFYSNNNRYSKKIRIESLKRLETDMKKELGIELDLITGGNLMIVNITLTI